jgi:micrococcal nuclease
MQIQYKVLLVINFITLILILPNNILARQIPNYPDGIIVKAVNNPKVYYIENNTKRPIESPNMLTSQFRWQDLIEVSPVELDAISLGAPMTFRDGSLLSNNGTVYIVSNSRVRPITSPQAFLSKGYKWNNIIPVSNAELSLHSKGDNLKETDNYPDGSLLLAPGGAVYKLESGLRRYIPSPLIFDSRYKWEYLIPVSQSIIESYPKGSDEYYPNGLLISSATGVFLMQNNQRLPITSPAVFESYGFKWGQIRRATDYELSIIPEGNAISEIKNYRSRVLISPIGSSAVYVVDVTGTLRYIPSPFIFEKLNYKWDQIIKIPANVLQQYPVGANKLFQDGTVVSYNGVVYLISSGYKKPISSPNIFLGLGYKWSDIIPLRLNEFNQYSTGNMITDISNDKYNVITVNDGDDIVVNINGKIEEIRLLGIDAPELDSFISSNYCYGVEAYQAVKNIIASNRVSLVKDPLKEDRDDYNRLLRYVYLEDGRSLQEYLLKEGYAKEYTHKGIFYQSQANHKALEQEAKDNKKGLWATRCNQN